MPGVESAFQFTDKVLTVSIHHYAEGFYPGTGSGTSTSTRVKSVVNIPMKAGLSDKTLSKVFDEMIAPLVEQFNPHVVVLQCGVDGECHCGLPSGSRLVWIQLKKCTNPN